MPRTYDRRLQGEQAREGYETSAAMTGPLNNQNRQVPLYAPGYNMNQNARGARAFSHGLADAGQQALARQQDQWKQALAVRDQARLDAQAALGERSQAFAEYTGEEAIRLARQAAEGSHVVDLVNAGLSPKSIADATGMRQYGALDYYRGPKDFAESSQGHSMYGGQGMSALIADPNTAWGGALPYTAQYQARQMADIANVSGADVSTVGDFYHKGDPSGVQPKQGARGEGTSGTSTKTQAAQEQKQQDDTARRARLAVLQPSDWYSEGQFNVDEKTRQLVPTTPEAALFMDLYAEAQAKYPDIDIYEQPAIIDELKKAAGFKTKAQRLEELPGLIEAAKKAKKDDVVAELVAEQKKLKASEEAKRAAKGNAPAEPGAEGAPALSTAPPEPKTGPVGIGEALGAGVSTAFGAALDAIPGVIPARMVKPALKAATALREKILEIKVPGFIQEAVRPGSTAQPAALEVTPSTNMANAARKALAGMRPMPSPDDVAKQAIGQAADRFITNPQTEQEARAWLADPKNKDVAGYIQTEQAIKEVDKRRAAEQKAQEEGLQELFDLEKKKMKRKLEPDEKKRFDELRELYGGVRRKKKKRSGAL